MSRYADPAMDPEFVARHEAIERAAFRTISRREHRARKAYCCWKCSPTGYGGEPNISPGERYVRTWGYVDGTLTQTAEHIECPARPVAA